ncbi:MAG TPA: 50S ribosomal protein L28 [Planctomycetota bacterium]|jgi:large subunit ribosomal protein L28|nr:50S ribosomal protein L28 [Planctomycetota bacterium]
MPRVCDVTGKRTQVGNQVTRRGKAKAEGGVGKKTTGITRRTFKPNLQTIRIVLPNGGLRRLRVAANVIKKGEVTISFEGRMTTLPIEKALRGRNKRRLEQLNLANNG